MLSGAELKAASLACGLAASATRASQLEALRAFYREQVASRPKQLGPILSLDLGLKNLAACVLDESSVSSWRKYDLNLPETYSPLTYAREIKSFCRRELLPSFPGKYIYIERQRHRSGSMPGIAETIVRLAILEAQLHCVLGEEFVCTPVNPSAVARFHNLPSGKEKKIAAVKCVQSSFLKTLHIPAPLQTYFQAQSKKDDLADSLLQAVAVLQFQRNCREFFEVKHPELLDESVIAPKKARRCK